MANNKQRYINTRFWNDGYISNLDPVEKLMFIYLLTNEHTNISGVYEIPIKIIGIETGIDGGMIKKILKRLEARIRYIDGFVVLKNFVKHQETGSELVQKGIVNCLKELDKKFLEKIVNKGFFELPQYYIDTLSIQYTRGLNYSDLDSNSNLDSSTEAPPPVPVFNLEEEIKKLEDNPRRDLNIIALYFEERKPDLRTKEQFQVALRQHLRAAAKLIPFTNDQILAAIPKAKKMTSEWTLDTVVKVLTK